MAASYNAKLKTIIQILQTLQILNKRVTQKLIEKETYVDIRYVAANAVRGSPF